MTGIAIIYSCPIYGQNEIVFIPRYAAAGERKIVIIAINFQIKPSPNIDKPRDIC